MCRVSRRELRTADGKREWRISMPALAAAILLTLASKVAGQLNGITGCSVHSDVMDLQLSPSLGDLSWRNFANSSLDQYHCHTWRLDAGTYMNPSNGCSGPDRWLLLEFWRMRQLSSGTWAVDSLRYVNDIYFLAAKDQAPQVYTDDELNASVMPAFNDGVWYKPGSPGDPGNSGTFMDTDADNYQRPYHRILIPNITALTPGSGGGSAMAPPTWYITVANLAQYNPAITPTTVPMSIAGYQIRATCVATRDIPCHRPDPSKGPCSAPVNSSSSSSGTRASHLPGICLQAPADAPTEPVCQCSEGYGNYGCDVPVTRVRDGDNVTISRLAGGAWKWFMVTVPPPSPPALPRQTLLVQLTRAVSSSYGAEPLLLVKPNTTQDRNVPFYYDVVAFADLHSWWLEGSTHYILKRDFISHGSSFYIGVLNGDGSSPATLSLSVRWATPTAPFFCPLNCSGVGTCFDPATFSSSAWLDHNALVPQDPSQGFICRCPPGYGGLTCEGSVTPVPVSTTPMSYLTTSNPGEIDYYLLPVQLSQSSYPSDEVNIHWVVMDSQGTPGNMIPNAYLTVDENQYSRQEDYSSRALYTRGYQAWYNAMVTKSSNPVVVVKGADLSRTGPLVIGVVNSVYTRSSPFTYTIEFSVPAPPYGWLHPYMSVVLGLTAAALLGLVMVVLRRLFLLTQQRQQWRYRGATTGGMLHVMGPFPPHGREGRDGGSPDTETTLTVLQLSALDAQQALMQVLPRPPGVPPSIITTFPTFTYTHADKPNSTGKAGGSTKSGAAVFQASSQQEVMQSGGRAPAPQKQQQQRTLRIGGFLRGRETPAATAGAVTGTGQDNPGVAGQDVGRAAAGGDEAAGRHTDSAPAQQKLQVPQGKQSEPVGSETSSTMSSSSMQHDGLSDQEEEPSCTVCLCEYECGDEIRRLPCGHDFHQACIDKWMTQHTTCPICRVGLVPQVVLDEMERERQAAAAAAVQSPEVTVIYIPGEDGQMIEVRGVPSARLRARSGQQAQQQQQQPQQQAGLFTGNSSSTSIAGAGETAPVAPAAPVPALDQAPVQIPAMSDTRAQGTG